MYQRSFIVCTFLFFNALFLEIHGDKDSKKKSFAKKIKKTKNYFTYSDPITIAKRKSKESWEEDYKSRSLEHWKVESIELPGDYLSGLEETFKNNLKEGLGVLELQTSCIVEFSYVFLHYMHILIEHNQVGKERSLCERLFYLFQNILNKQSTNFILKERFLDNFEENIFSSLVSEMLFLRNVEYDREHILDLIIKSVGGDQKFIKHLELWFSSDH
jgi:hypothetical protein